MPELTSLCTGKMAEWSKAPGLGPGLFGGVGSNPTLVIPLFKVCTHTTHKTFQPIFSTIM